MSKTKASAMKIENSMTEEYISDPVIKTLTRTEDIFALSETIDRARLAARDILMEGIGAYFNIYFVDEPDWEFCSRLKEYQQEGNIGLEKCLAEISNSLRFEYLRLKQNENRIVS